MRVVLKVMLLFTASAPSGLFGWAAWMACMYKVQQVYKHERVCTKKHLGITN